MYLSIEAEGTSSVYTVCSKEVKAFVPCAPIELIILSYSFAMAYLLATPETESIW
jgi:hypothetical protein